MHPITITVATQSFSVITLVGQQPSAAFAGTTAQAGNVGLIQQRLGIGNVAGLAAGKQETQRHAIGVAQHVNLGRQAAPAATERMVMRLFRPPFFPAPDEARVARAAVESIIQVSRSIKPCSFNRI